MIFYRNILYDYGPKNYYYENAGTKKNDVIYN